MEQQPELRYSVLLVEDDERVRSTLEILLRWSGGWDLVGSVADGASALDLADAHHPRLVLLDRWLPDGDSLGLLPQLRALQPAPLIVILSADAAEASREYALAQGADSYLTKTTPPLDLLEVLRALCDAGVDGREP